MLSHDPRLPCPATDKAGEIPRAFPGDVPVLGPARPDGGADAQQIG